MSIVGDRPEGGLRIALERPRDGGPPWRYSGEVRTNADRFTVRVTVEEGGEVAVEIASGEGGAAPPSDFADKVKLVVRSAYRHAGGGSAPPPRRIARWRGEK